MSVNNIVTGKLPTITTYDSNGNITGIVTANVTSTGNVTATGNVAGGNVIGTYLRGDGSNITNVTGTYGNANVTTLLSGGTVTSNVITTGNISTASGYFLGNGALLTGIPASYSNAIASAYLASGTDSANIVTTANVSGNYLLGNVAFATGLPDSSQIVNGTSNVVVAASGNVTVSAGGTANVITAQSTGVVTVPTLNATTVNATTANAANVTNNNLSMVGNVLGSVDTVMYIDPSKDGSSATGNVVILGNLTVGGNLTYSSVSSATTANLLWQAASTANTPGDANGAGLSAGANAAPFALFTYNSTSNAWVSNIGLASTNGANIGANLGVVGNVTGSYFLGNGSQLTGLPIQYANANVSNYLASGTNSANIVTTGNVTAANFTTTGSAGNISGVNYFLGNAATVTGNVTATYFLGNGSQLTGLPVQYGNANVSNYLASATNTANIATTGNVTGNYYFGNAYYLAGVSAKFIANGSTNIGIVTANGAITFTVANSEAGNISVNNTAMGYQAASVGSGTGATTFGAQAGLVSQGANSVSVGFKAGWNTQGPNAISVGAGAGLTTQGQGAVAVGLNAGAGNQGNTAVAIGQGAGTTSQSINAVAIGTGAGGTTQGATAVAIGSSAGSTTQGANSVAIGQSAGSSALGADSVAIGTSAGANAGVHAVSVGAYAGQFGQQGDGVAIGYQAGQLNQGVAATAIGYAAGANTQGNFTVALGHDAGNNNQGQSAVAIGSGAGIVNQGSKAIAIGDTAGGHNQGQNAIAIGYYSGNSNQASNSIVINASGLEHNNTDAGSMHLLPVRETVNANDNTNPIQGLYYNAGTSEVSYYPTNMYSAVFPTIGGGTLGDSSFGSWLQINANETLPLGAPTGTKLNFTAIAGTTDGAITITAQSGGFIYTGNQSLSSISLYTGETLELVSRGSSNEWDISGGTAGLRYQGYRTNNTISTPIKSALGPKTAFNNWCYLDNFGVRYGSDGRIFWKMTDGSTTSWIGGGQAFRNDGGVQFTNTNTTVGTGEVQINVNVTLSTAGDTMVCTMSQNPASGTGSTYRITVVKTNTSNQAAIILERLF